MTSQMERYLLSTKHLVFQVTYGLGIHRIARAINSMGNRRLTIVTYHRVTDRDVEQIDGSFRNLFVNVETFEKQITFLKRNYSITSPGGLCKSLDNGRLCPDSALITFDDGYKDFHRFAYPVLKRLAVPVTLFIVPGKVGNRDGSEYWWDEMYRYLRCIEKREREGMTGSMPAEIGRLYVRFKDSAKMMFDDITDRCSDTDIEEILEGIRRYLGDADVGRRDSNEMLTWEDMEEMSDLVEIGSHTMRHRNMKYLSGDDLYEEIHRSKTEIEKRTKKEVVAFSYPGGYYSPEIVRQVRDAGYRFAFTTEKGVNDLRDRYRMRRINVWERTSSVRTKPFSEGKLAMKMVGF